MKKLILLASCATLWACAESAVEEDAPVEANAVEVEDAAMVEDDGYGMRTYTWTGPEGEAMVTSTSGEGAYITDANGEHFDHGTVMMNDEGKLCFESAMDQPDGCWTYSDLDIGGSMETTSDEGETMTVTRTEYADLSMPGG